MQPGKPASGASRTDVADQIVTGAFVFVRKARARGCTNQITTLLLMEIAETRGISGDSYSLRTCRTLARRRAQVMDETHLLAEEIR